MPSLWLGGTTAGQDFSLGSSTVLCGAVEAPLQEGSLGLDTAQLFQAGPEDCSVFSDRDLPLISAEIKGDSHNL